MGDSVSYLDNLLIRCIRALSTNILSIVLKYLIACLVVERQHKALINPISGQHVLKKQSVFCNFNRCFDISELSASEVRLIQAAKSKSSSCPRKNPCRELWPIC